jgi:hypothetical protein
MKVIKNVRKLLKMPSWKAWVERSEVPLKERVGVQALK